MSNLFGQMGGQMALPGYPSSFPPAMDPNEQEGSRTIYIGNIPETITATEILNHVRSGPVEALRILREKSCAFLAFMDAGSARLFYHQHPWQRLIIKDNELKLGWGKPSSLPASVAKAAQQGATRNVYLGNIDTQTVTQQSLETDFAQYGEIDRVRVLAERRCAFVHFTTVNAAVKCMETLQGSPEWKDRRVGYGRDRCMPKGNDPHSHQHQHQQHQQQHQQYPFNFQHPMRPSSSASSSSFGFDPYGMMMSSDDTQNTLYIGNIPRDCSVEDLCNTIRGGALFQVKFIPDKGIAFLTFLDPLAARHVHHTMETTGFTLRSRRLRCGWAKSVIIPAQAATAARNGASRNVYIGGIENDLDLEQVRQDFSVYGEVEQINRLEEKNCVFVNFLNLTNAMRAVNEAKHTERYKDYKISFGKDRCANPQKASQQQQSKHDDSGDKKTKTDS